MILEFIRQMFVWDPLVLTLSINQYPSSLTVIIIIVPRPSVTVSRTHRSLTEAHEKSVGL